MNVEGVLATDVDGIWPDVEPLIDQAVVYGDGKIAAEDIHEAIRSRDMQLWIVPGGVWVTRIVTYPRSTRLEMVAAAGKWDDWMTHAETVIKWAKLQGCDAIEVIGRPGWGRKTGFEEIHRVFRVRI